jgi:transcriptional regulator with XRE-family HTH domain
MKHGDTPIADRLVRARKLAEPQLSARELDRLAGLHQGHVWAIENGHRPNIETDTCIALARVLGVSLDWLLTGDAPGPKRADVTEAVNRARAANDTHPKAS